MRFYKEDLEYLLKVLWFLENVDAPDGFFPDFKVSDFNDSFPLGFTWDGEWYVALGEDA